MKRLSISQNAVDYTDDINSNFAAILVDNTTVSTNIETQGGRLSESDGYILSGITSNSDFFNYLHTIDFIKYGNILSIDDNIDGTISIFCYDGNFSLISVVSSIANISFDVAYIKIQIYNGDGFANVTPVSVSTRGRVVLSKNTTPTLGASKFFSYEVKRSPVEDVVGNNYNGYLTRYYDNGYIILPPNYDPLGEPVQLIIYTHGSDCWKFGATSVDPYYDLQQFITKNGYAVADCRGITNEFKDSDSGRNIDDGITPISITCYCQLYNYLIRNFNIRQDGCYIYGKSSGGLEPALLSNLQTFPIRAAAGLAPMLSQYQDMFNGVNYYQNVRWELERFGYDMTQVSSIPTASQILSQITKMQGYDPLISNTKLDIVEFNTLLQSISSGSTYQWNESMINNTSLQNAVTGVAKYQRCPIKFWIVTDDVNTPINFAALLYKQLVDQGNGICKIRRFESGGHHVVDNSPNAPKTIYHTMYGGDVSVPVAYAEMIDWFKEW